MIIVKRVGVHLIRTLGDVAALAAIAIGPLPAATIIGKIIRSCRRNVVVLSAALALLAGVAAATPASAQANASGNARSRCFWLVMTPGESFTQAASQAARTSGGQVAPTLREMTLRLEAGNGVYIPEGTGSGITLIRASAADLAQAQAAVAQVRTNGEYGSSASPALTPEEYPVRGAACDNNYAWCNLVLQVAADYCEETCTLEDEITARLKVNPGANEVSTVSFTSIYSPNNGDFEDIHFDWYTMVFAGQGVCGSDSTETYSPNGSAEFFALCNTQSYNSRLSHAFTLWAYLIPTASYVPDHAKTGICIGRAAPDANCVY